MCFSTGHYLSNNTLDDIELGDIGDIGQSQCHNSYEGERKKSHVTL